MALLTRLLSLVYPPRCVACDDLLADERPFCDRCAESLYPVDVACRRCSLPVDLPPERAPPLCRRCRLVPPAFSRVIAPYRYGGELATALRRLKFDRRADIARSLAHAPALVGAFAAAAGSADVAIAVPLHWRRLVARGFNQAALLLAELRRAAGSPIRIDATAFTRRRASAPQSGLTARQRRSNVAGAFAPTRRGGSRITGLRILLVDDIVTTGATMAAAASSLLRAGADDVIGFAVARAEI